MATLHVLPRKTKRDEGLKQASLSPIQVANIHARVKGKGTYMQAKNLCEVKAAIELERRMVPTMG